MDESFFYYDNALFGRDPVDEEPDLRAGDYVETIDSSTDLPEVLPDTGFRSHLGTGGTTHLRQSLLTTVLLFLHTQRGQRMAMPTLFALLQ
ncbi:hypothetical protein EJ02DRAFT_203850 [Clathrospora elynae]|uniref:Uncharacterized protein n=1 Tax=Clathrospora elynae TaxID=706981 RepID=A0A6A5SL39_9PLEO|nr:hypothetical protein EJ02DRAFT_203850 [Clathrospora elynae]